MTNLYSVWKHRNITLLQKVHIVKAMVFLVVMYRCQSWTIEKAEHWRIYAFEPWCWRRLLRVPQIVRRSNPSILWKSILNIHWKYCWWSWSSNTLAILCEEQIHWKRSYVKSRFIGKDPMWRADSLEKILNLGKIEGSRRWRWQRMRWMGNTTNSMDMNLGKLWKIEKDREAWHAVIYWVTKHQTLFSNWTTFVVGFYLRDCLS